MWNPSGENKLLMDSKGSESQGCALKFRGRFKTAGSGLRFLDVQASWSRVLDKVNCDSIIHLNFRILGKCLKRYFPGGSRGGQSS